MHRTEFLVARRALLSAGSGGRIVDLLAFEAHRQGGCLGFRFGFFARDCQIGLRLLGRGLGGGGAGGGLLRGGLRCFGLPRGGASLVVGLFGLQQPRIAGNSRTGAGQRRGAHDPGRVRGRRLVADGACGLLGHILDGGTHKLSSLSCLSPISQFPSWARAPRSSG